MSARKQVKNSFSRTRGKCWCIALALSGGLLISGSMAAGEGPGPATTLTLRFEIPVLASDQSGETDQGVPPAAIRLRGLDARWQLLVTAERDGQTCDVTRQAAYRVHPPGIVEVSPAGYLAPVRNGRATVTARWQGAVAEVEVEVTDADALQPVNFPLQVEPIFTKFGCNGGGCHGKASGQGGFKLSLLGFEPLVDYERLVLESRGRRLFPAAPSQSLLLLKATGQVPHGGGARIAPDSHEYRLLVRWIAGGMPFGGSDDPVVTGIDIIPDRRSLPPGAEQQLAVIAHYSDGHIEDITRTAQYESNNTDLAEVDPAGLVRLRDAHGDVAVMARYQGQVAVTRFAIPLSVDPSQFAWPAERNLVDRLVFAKLRALRMPPAAECDDGTFIRRVTLDLAGRLPTPEETQQFLTDTDPGKIDALVDRLLRSTEHAEYFAKKWSAILRNRRVAAGDQLGTYALYEWLRDRIHENMPYDSFARELLTATGSPDINPAAVWLRQVRSTEERLEDAAQLFLGQRLQCAKCHHHPYEKWSQRDYYQMAAFFSTTSRLEDEIPEEPRYVSRVARATSRHPKTGETLLPAGLDAPPVDLPTDRDPRAALADWITGPNNPFFARMLVNRYWKHLFGVGIVDPEDDMRVTNPPTNPELLDGLADYLVSHGFDTRELLRLICTSTVYRLDSVGNDYNMSDRTAFSRYYPQRLPAEVLLDAVDAVLWTHTDFTGLPPGTRAVSLPDTAFGSYFLEVFGEPDSATACECERSGEVTLAQTLHLMNSKDMYTKLTRDDARPAAMAASSDPVPDQLRQLYVAAFCRLPTADELAAAADYLESKQRSREAYEDLVWAIINSKEFLFNH
ncbi:MAG: DUF1553 domain-containing protein [Planctomycetota bacterium]|nr:MAG: DUF1553 domain-containing protein [Planctomycetota bacterium]